MKLIADLTDISHLLRWLQNHNEKIDFVKYNASVPGRLYDGVRTLRAYWVVKGETEGVELLDSALQETDKAIVMGM
jgi:hypothetical protein